MNSDFFYLGESLEILSSVEASPLKAPLVNFKSRVILIELSLENVSFFNGESKYNFTDCIFIYYLSKSDKISEEWRAIFNTLRPLFVLKKEEVRIEHLKEGLREVREKEQRGSLFKMLKEDKVKFEKEHNNKILNFKNLEIKLVKANKRAKQIKIEEDLNLRCLEIIFNAQNIDEIEDLTLPVLKESLNLLWMRILPLPLEVSKVLTEVKEQKIYRMEVFDLDHDQDVPGKVIFSFKGGSKKNTGEEALLQRICDALSLRIKQLSVEKKIKNTKTQWETTFKSLPFKAALIDKDYNILQTGGEYTSKDLKKPCYETFFQRKSPCPSCKLGTDFLVDQKNESLEVISKKIFDPVQDEYYFLNFYRDFEVSTLGDSHQATKTKLEELGVISGSIAHELNNPLGGIKILLELLGEDESFQTDPLREDLKILKGSTKKCIDIVSELLNFTRPKITGKPLKKPLSHFFNQLSVFTQAYLLSEGFVLKIQESSYLKLILHSPDSTLPIKLLEAVAHFIKKIKKNELGGDIKEIYLFARYLSVKDFEIVMSNKLDSRPKNKNFQREDTLSLSLIRSEFNSYNDDEHSMVLRFQVESGVKASETDV